MKLKIMNWEILENALLVRNGYVFEFVKSNKNWYGYKWADAKNGWLGKWYIYERDVAGYGIEHAAHTLPKSKHRSVKGERDVAKWSLNIMPFLDMKGDLPYVVGYDQMKKVVARLLEKDLRLGKDDIISWFLTIGSDWNLLSKHLIDNLIFKMRSRLSVKINDKNNLEDLKTFDDLPLGRKLLEIKCDSIKQYVMFLYSPFQELALQSSPTLYLSTSFPSPLPPQWTHLLSISTLSPPHFLPLCFILLQSLTPSTISSALSHLISSLSLSPSTLVLSPCPHLTQGVISTFPNSTKYLTHPYLTFAYLTHRAHRLSLFSQGLDLHVHRLLKWLKALVYVESEEVKEKFGRVKDYFRKYCSSFGAILDEFEEVFIEGYNGEFWKGRGGLEEGRWLEEAEGVVKGSEGDWVGVEKWVRKLMEGNNNTTYDTINNNSNNNYMHKIFKQKEERREVEEYWVMRGIVDEGRDYIEEELSKNYSFPTEVEESAK
jgi:hypothetical protein